LALGSTLPCFLACLSFFSFNLFYSRMSFLLISAFSSSSYLNSLRNSSVRWEINEAIFLSGRSCLLLSTFTRHNGHSFLPWRL
jgi:hypothetical protein